MGRPITDRRTGSVGGLCDSLRPERQRELTGLRSHVCLNEEAGAARRSGDSIVVSAGR
jgi:hypothetical protein